MWDFRTFFRCLIGAAFLCFGAEGFGTTFEHVKELFHAGEYDETIELAISLDTPESLTLAAESLSAKVMLKRVDDPVDAAEQARKWAKAALKQRPDAQETQLQYALAYGFETRSSSPMRAWRKGLIKKSRRSIDTYRENFPDDPRGDALLAAWHLGIVRRLDEKRAKDWFGASKAEGVALYEMSIEKAPFDLVIAGNYAITLLSLDIQSYKGKAFEIIEAMAESPARNALDRDVKDMIAMLPDYASDDILEQRVNELLD